MLPQNQRVLPRRETRLVHLYHPWQTEVKQWLPAALPTVPATRPQRTPSTMVPGRRSCISHASCQTRRGQTTWQPLTSIRRVPLMKRYQGNLSLKGTVWFWTFRFIHTKWNVQYLLGHTVLDKELALNLIKNWQKNGIECWQYWYRICSRIVKEIDKDLA